MAKPHPTHGQHEQHETSPTAVRDAARQAAIDDEARRLSSYPQGRQARRRWRRRILRVG